ncbi:MAG: hypothetical protein U0667_06710 [Chloroflexota bacterium]
MKTRMGVNIVGYLLSRFGTPGRTDIRDDRGGIGTTCAWASSA